MITRDILETKRARLTIALSEISGALQLIEELLEEIDASDVPESTDESSEIEEA